MHLRALWTTHWDLLLATAVTQGWNGYRNKSTELTLEKKTLLLLLPWVKPQTFQSWVHHSTIELYLLPVWILISSQNTRLHETVVLHQFHNCLLTNNLCDHFWSAYHAYHYHSTEADVPVTCHSTEADLHVRSQYRGRSACQVTVRRQMYMKGHSRGRCTCQVTVQRQMYMSGHNTEAYVHVTNCLHGTGSADKGQVSFWPYLICQLHLKY